VGEITKISYINSIFDKAGKSDFSIIILDNLLGLIRWNEIGLIYFNSLLLIFEVYIRALPPKICLPARQ
jgi:vesicle-fusing ATPase